MAEQETEGAVLIPMDEAVDAIQQFQPVELLVTFVNEAPGGTLLAEVLQVIPSGIAVILEDPVDAVVLAGGATAADPATPPAVSVAASEATAPGEDRSDSEEEEPQKKWISRRKSGPLSWSFDMLQSQWNGLTPAEKARVAKWGDRSARGLVLKKQDRMLQAVLLTNPKLTPNEVAVLVAKPGLNPELLLRIGVSREWTRHLSVTRALVCNPKLPIPQVNRLLKTIDLGELRRLSRSGRVRTVVKREIDKQIARITGRGRRS